MHIWKWLVTSTKISNFRFVDASKKTIVVFHCFRKKIDEINMAPIIPDQHHVYFSESFKRKNKLKSS